MLVYENFLSNTPFLCQIDGLMACLLFTQIGIAQGVVQDEEGWAHQKTFLKEESCDYIW